LDVARRVSAAADTTQSAGVFVDGNPVTFRAVGGSELDWRVTAAFDEYKLVASRRGTLLKWSEPHDVLSELGEAGDLSQIRSSGDRRRRRPHRRSDAFRA
jgi:hypothetical protein